MSCGGNGSSSNSYGTTSDYTSTGDYNEPSQPQYYPCPDCNSTGYMEDYSGNTYPCVKCGGEGDVKISGGSQPSFTGNKFQCKYGGCTCTYYEANGVYDDRCKYCKHPKHKSSYE